MKNTYHRDGTVTYWSVYSQTWIIRSSNIPDREYAAMSASERDEIERHFATYSDNRATGGA